MSIAIHSTESRTSINWANGTSTEIFIYPANGSFSDRNFLFRISTATVEAEESTFTFFEGITRHLMILKGELELIHDGRYSKKLKPYDQDTFSGEWSTQSRGKVSDFNLMLKGSCTGSLTHHFIEPAATVTIIADTDFHFVYIASGEVALSNGSVARTGDLIQTDKDSTLQLTGQADVVEIRVKLN